MIKTQLTLYAWCFVGYWMFAAQGHAVQPTTPKPGAAKVRPWLQTTTHIHHLKIDPKGRYAAYLATEKRGLMLLDLKTRKLYRVSKQQVGGSYFWAPHGHRLFYRELAKTKDGQIWSHIKAYDRSLHKSITIEDIPVATGFLTFDPRDLKIAYMHPFGVRSKKILFPDERLARWQIAQRTENGKFLGTQKGILWLTQGGYAMRRFKDSNQPVSSFAISPDGSTIAWATRDAKIYISERGQPARLLAHGKDPAWHPSQQMLLFAGARMVGNVPINYDLRISNLKEPGWFITNSQFTDERWPQWHPNGKQIIFTRNKSARLYLLDLERSLTPKVIQPTN